MPRNVRSKLHQQRRSVVPRYVALEMLGEMTVFCERCETQVVGGLVSHAELHRDLPGAISSLVVTYT